MVTTISRAFGATTAVDTTHDGVRVVFDFLNNRLRVYSLQLPGRAVRSRTYYTPEAPPIW